MGLVDTLCGTEYCRVGDMIIGNMVIQEAVERGVLVIRPFYPQKTIFEGMSYGLSEAGYDIRLAQDLKIKPGGFVKGSAMEYLSLPVDLIASVYDKSSLARMGIAVQNTIIEPGWRGYLTLEISNHGEEIVELVEGHPIAQLVFQEVRGATAYQGKYQDQGPGPQDAILEG